METIGEYLRLKEGTNRDGLLANQVSLSSGIGDWFNDFIDKIKAGDIGAIALVGVAAIVIWQLIVSLRR